MCNGSSTFATPDKTEVMLMNVLIPLCIRVGSGRKGESTGAHGGVAHSAQRARR